MRRQMIRRSVTTKDCVFLVAFMSMITLNYSRCCRSNLCNRNRLYFWDNIVDRDQLNSWAGNDFKLTRHVIRARWRYITMETKKHFAYWEEDTITSYCRVCDLYGNWPSHVTERHCVFSIVLYLKSAMSTQIGKRLRGSGDSHTMLLDWSMHVSSLLWVNSDWKMTDYAPLSHLCHKSRCHYEWDSLDTFNTSPWWRSMGSFRTIHRWNTPNARIKLSIANIFTKTMQSHLLNATATQPHLVQGRSYVRQLIFMMNTHVDKLQYIALSPECMTQRRNSRRKKETMPMWGGKELSMKTKTGQRRSWNIYHQALISASGARTDLNPMMRLITDTTIFIIGNARCINRPCRQ